MNKTLTYYNNNAIQFCKDTIHVNFKETQEIFLNKLTEGAHILDFGCGSGRDAKYFIRKGFSVDAIDGSNELCKLASEYIGTNVTCMLFQDLNEVEKYDGIWACSSILHLSKSELKLVLKKMICALKAKGIVYTSFKYGDFEGVRNGRYFTNFTLESFQKYIEDFYEIEVEKSWITGDVRPGRGEEKWLNLILRKK